MTGSTCRDTRRIASAVLLTGLLLAGCDRRSPVSPLIGSALLAKGSGGGGRVSVTSADPDTVSTDTTLTIAIYGSGFSPGAQVEYLLGTQASQKVVATAVQFVSSSQLNATTTVAADAPLASYDIAVMSNGKRGIGAEKLAVIARAVMLEEPDGAVASEAFDVNEAGVIVGTVRDAAGASQAMRWTPVGKSWSGTVIAPGIAVAVNAAGEVLRVEGGGVQGRWFVHTASGAVVELPGANTGTMSMDLSDDGTITGVTTDDDGASYAAFWVRTGPGSWSGPTMLPAPDGYAGSTPSSISSDGTRISGTLRNTSGMPFEMAGVWQRSGSSWSVTMLGPGWPAAVNGSGVAVGLQSTDSCSWGYCYSAGVAWLPPSATLVSLEPTGSREGSPNSRPLSINQAGQIAGVAMVPTSASKKRVVTRRVGAVWPSWNSPPIPLLPPVGAPDEVSMVSWKISDGGLVVSSLHRTLGQSHAVVWVLP